MHEITNWLRLEWRQPLMFCLKFFGFVLGFVSVLLLLTYVNFESGYDSWNPDADRIARAVEVRDVSNQSRSFSMPYPFADAVKAGIGEVEEVARMQPLRAMLQSGDAKYNETLLFVEPAFLKFFHVRLQAGAENPLQRPFSLIISQRAAEKYFGRENPLGKTLSLGGKRDLTVSAVMPNWPEDSHLSPDFLLPLDSFFQMVEEKAKIKRDKLTGWNNCHCYPTYIKLKNGADFAKVNAALHDVLVKNQGADYAKSKPASLQALRDAYLNSSGIQTSADHARKGDKVQIAVMLAIGGILLFTAAINFANFSLAQASMRAKEVAVRRVLGASANSIVLRICAESFMLCCLALLLSYLLAIALLSPAAAFLQRPLQTGMLFAPSLVLQVLLAAFSVTAVAGAFSALTLARAKPVELLRSGVGVGSMSSAKIRMAMVLLQFVISSALIIAAFGVHSQISYVREVPRGFNGADKVILKGEGSHAVHGELMARLKAVEGVKAVSIANMLPTTPQTNIRQLLLQGKPVDENRNIALNETDFGMLKSLGVKTLAGRGLSEEFGADHFVLPPPGKSIEVSAVINRSASLQLGFANEQEALNKVLIFADDADAGFSLRIVGVVEDIRYGSAREKVGPMAYIARDDWQANRHESRYLLLTVNNAHDLAMLTQIGQVWNSMVPDFVSEVSPLSDALEAQMRGEQKQFQMIGVFTVAAVIVSLFGVLGLASFMMRRRARELAIRQALGATRMQISWLVTATQLKLVGLAAVLSCPLVYWILVRWLDGFDLRSQISAWWFIGGSTLNIVLAMTVLLVFSNRIAARSPVEYLRGE